LLHCRTPLHPDLALQDVQQQPTLDQLPRLPQLLTSPAVLLLLLVLPLFLVFDFRPLFQNVLHCRLSLGIDTEREPAM
jgi:hypothetical protein